MDAATKDFGTLLRSIVPNPTQGVENDRTRKFYHTPAKRIVAGTPDGNKLVDVNFVGGTPCTSQTQLESLTKEVRLLKQGKLDLALIPEESYEDFGLNAGGLGDNRLFVKGAGEDSANESGDDNSIVVEGGGAGKDKKPKPKPKKADSKGGAKKKTSPKYYDFNLEGGFDAGSTENSDETWSLREFLADVKKQMMQEAEQIIRAGGNPYDYYNPDTPLFGGKPITKKTRKVTKTIPKSVK